MKIRRRYECEVCGETEVVEYEDWELVPTIIDCTICGLSNRMYLLPPKVANHYHPSKGR